MVWTISTSSGETISAADDNEAAQAMWEITQRGGDDVSDAAHATRDGDR